MGSIGIGHGGPHGDWCRARPAASAGVCPYWPHRVWAKSAHLCGWGVAFGLLRLAGVDAPATDACTVLLALCRTDGLVVAQTAVARERRAVGQRRQRVVLGVEGIDRVAGAASASRRLVPARRRGCAKRGPHEPAQKKFRTWCPSVTGPAMQRGERQGGARHRVPGHANRAYRLREEVSGESGPIGREGLDRGCQRGKIRDHRFENGSFGTVSWIAAAEQHEAHAVLPACLIVPNLSVWRSHLMLCSRPACLRLHDGNAPRNHAADAPRQRHGALRPRRPAS